MKIKVEIDAQWYEVEVADIHAHPVVAVIEGERYEVWLDSPEASQMQASAPLDFSRESPTLAADPRVQEAGTENDVRAPLPGVIVAIQVKPGDRVTRGQELCTLEAMKMKNAIKSTRDGTIASIEINIGDQVGHDQLMMTMKN